MRDLKKIFKCSEVTEQSNSDSFKIFKCKCCGVKVKCRKEDVKYLYGNPVRYDNIVDYSETGKVI